jgi:hypothetical protein
MRAKKATFPRTDAFPVLAGSGCRKLICLPAKQELNVVLMGCYEYVIPRR